MPINSDNTIPVMSPPLDLLEKFGLLQQGEAERRLQSVQDKGIEVLTGEGQLPALAADTRPIVIVGGGPSLNQADSATGKTVLNELDARNDIKVVIGSTHGRLEKFKNNSMNYAVIGLTDMTMKQSFETLDPGVTYIVAAQVEPAFFDHLLAERENVKTKTGKDVRILAFNAGALSSGVGSTAGTAALAVFADLLGKKEFEFYGVDGSTEYAFENIPTPGHSIVAGYKIADNFLPQLEEFGRFSKANPGLKLHFNGQCAHAALYNAPAAVPVAPPAPSMQ
jgi:hypothetical protein